MSYIEEQFFKGNRFGHVVINFSDYDKKNAPPIRVIKVDFVNEGSFQAEGSPLDYCNIVHNRLRFLQGLLNIDLEDQGLQRDGDGTLNVNPV